MKITACKTNHMTNPLGFAMDYAVVSWIAESEISKKQDRAQIVVALDPAMKNIIYTSAPLANPNSTGMQLPIKLQPRTAYYWTVQVWGDQGDTAVSEVNCFETGKREEPLDGQWITTPWEDQSRSPYMRKGFCLEEKPEKARLYMVGLGLALPEINGERINEEYFAPGCTAGDKWVQIYTYDVSKHLQAGENMLAVLLGNGWIKGPYGNKPHIHKNAADRFLLKAELRLEWADGREQVIVTDESWECAQSPILFNTIYDGEIYDARQASLDKRSLWEKVQLAENVKLGNLEDRLSLPIIIKERIAPIELIHTPDGHLVLDLGQNIAGWVRMRVAEPAGTCIKMSFGEILQNGCFYRGNLGKAKQEYVYISDGTEKWAEPHFTFYGFRYVKLERSTDLENGQPVDSAWEPALSDFEGCVVYSDLEETGWLTTSDWRINRLFANAKWSQKDNFLDLPTDCPQRNERQGWTGDAQVICKTASYNMETYAFFSKFLHDLWKDQEYNKGMVGHVVPCLLEGVKEQSAFWDGGSCAWGDAATIIPWTLYRHYGDVTILKRQYDSMKAWIDWILRTYVDDKGLWSGGFHFGDWLALDGHEEDDRYGGTDVTYIASAYLKYSAGLVAEAAKVLAEEAPLIECGEWEVSEDGSVQLTEGYLEQLPTEGQKEHLQREEAYYRQISDRTKVAIQKAYFTSDGECLVPTQTARVLALAFDLVEAADRPKVALSLAEMLRANGMQLMTGFVGTPFLCKVLSENGYSQEAYEILFREEFPSWLYAVQTGATTIWERWNAVRPDGTMKEPGDNSLNHYTYGSIARWMYENMIGLTLTEPGFKRFRVKPEFTDKLTFAEAKYNSPKGLIEVKWERMEDGKYSVYVKVPFDTTAEVELSDNVAQRKILLAGEHFLST